MLDTVILNLPQGKFRITKPDNFVPSTRNINFAAAFSKHVNNATAQDKKNGIYLPRLTIVKRGAQISLKVEFSASKLVYGNNLDELKEKDFKNVWTILKDKLWHMGVFVSEPDLIAAEVSCFHVSKNVLLSGGYTATFAIKEIAKVNLSRRYDFDKVDFRNEGHSLQLYSNSHSLVIYDKMSDLNKPKGRAIDKVQTKGQQSLFSLVKNEAQRTPEILRLEVRLSKKVKMNEVLQKLGFKQNPTFQEIFQSDMCRQILLLYWDNYLEPTAFVFGITTNPLAILRDIAKNNRGIKPKQAIYLTGLNLLAKDMGLRELRRVIEVMSSGKTWERTVKDFGLLNKQVTAKNTHGFVQSIKQSIAEMGCYRTGISPNLPKPTVHNPYLEYH
jgi:hypothetical protein